MIRVAEHGGTGSGDDAPATLEATLDGDPVSLPGPLFVSAVDRALRIRVPS
ncbi:MAG TPA: hypothetical protein VMM12_14490 [Longimicrobiales bacterium]|nr:hypothetical protein [Longimicrobiales bacterium]